MCAIYLRSKKYLINSSEPELNELRNYQNFNNIDKKPRIRLIL